MDNAPVLPNRRTLLKTAGMGAVGLPFLTSCSGPQAQAVAASAPALLPTPPGQVLAGAIFAAPCSGPSPSVTLDFYARTGLGTFTKDS